MKLAVPDLISNSYFPLIAAIDLGCFADEGLDVALEMIFPVSKAYDALKSGAVDFVGGSAHSLLSAFPDAAGARLLAAQAQGMYWFLVMRPDLAAGRGDLSVVKGRRIGAAPWVDLGLKRLLAAAGLDEARDDIRIQPVPAAVGGGVNFGVTAAQALADGQIDGFWANGMGTAVAMQRGSGAIVLDVRRGDGPAGCFDYTFASLAVRDDMPDDRAAAAVRALRRAQQALIADPSLATPIGRKRFPATEAALIAGLIAADAPYYDAAIGDRAVAGLVGFCRDMGLTRQTLTRQQLIRSTGQ